MAGPLSVFRAQGTPMTSIADLKALIMWEAFSPDRTVA